MLKQKKVKTNHGSALLLAIILLFVVLSMVVSLTYVTVMEQKMSSKTKSSVGSFFNADSGVEWALNQIANATGSNPTIADAFPAFASNKTDCPSGFDCEVYFLDANGKVLTASSALLSDIKAVRSVGSQTAGGEATQRAIEAAVAASCNSELLSGWPDVIACGDYPNGDFMFFYLRDYQAGSTFYVATRSTGGNLSYVQFNSGKNISGWQELPVYATNCDDMGASITTLPRFCADYKKL